MIKEPVKRSKLRYRLGIKYFEIKRYFLWFKMRKHFALEKQIAPLPYSCFTHKTLLRRKLKNVDMWMQENKIINLKLATACLNGILLRPGETFSYWRLIGKTTKRKGYVDGMILKNGGFEAGIGGGLCQLSNLICWMTMHSPLTIIERHRHQYDVFPDSNRTQPFASGATCSYPHVDLMIQNNTNETYQLFVTVGKEYLEGEWRVSAKPATTYKIVERNHRMEPTYWGGYIRHNELYQQAFDKDGNILSDVLLFENNALMMYSPLLNSPENKQTAEC